MAEQAPPFGQDLVTRIINVQWGAGMAVEFGDGDTDAPPPIPAPATEVG
jgi:hypothetical protein